VPFSSPNLTISPYSCNNATDSYTLQASHPLFVRAQRTVTVTITQTMTVPKLGLWAGDLNQDQKVTW
jgi:hypothetical protein